MARVSVLVAVYNAERYLPKCLDSLLGQTLHDIEILCVDDCSTDGSLALLQQYAERDARISYWHLDSNQGQGHARNVALEHATGTYVTFLDSDDRLAPDALQQAVSVFEAHPLTGSVLFSVVYSYPGRQEPMPQKPFVMLSGTQAFEQSLGRSIHGVYMVRADIHSQHPYDTSCRWYSDDNTTRLHYLSSSEVRPCAGVYYYRQTPQSVTHQLSGRRFEVLRANESMRRQLRLMPASRRHLAMYERQRWLTLIDTYMFHYVNRHVLTPQELRHGMAEMRRVWQNIDTRLLPASLKRKPGYIPFRPWWPLFRLQEELYFFLRKCLGRNRGV